jgi:uncharacterized OB-fold protein
VAGGTVDYTVSDAGVLHAPLDLFYPYTRTVGPTISRFLTGLRDGRIEGVKAADGRVVVPPLEFDLVTGDPLTEWVTVADTGTVTLWTWVPTPLVGQPLQTPFAFALITLDGADVPMLHAVDCQSPSNIATGTRVRARWAAEADRVGAMSDITCFEVIA